MAIIYNKVARKNPTNKQIKYYVTVKTIKLATLRDIALQVAEKETLSEHEVEHVLNSFVSTLQRMLLNGYSVRLGDWASMHVTCTSEGAATPKECKPELIKRVNVRTDYSEAFQEKMQKAQWVAAEDLHTTDAKTEG